MLAAGLAVAPPAGAGNAQADPGSHIDRAAAPAGEPAARPSRDLTRAVQQALLAAGHDPGPPDGLMGPRTRGAIRDFQRRHGLKEDGRISGGLIDALKDALGSLPRTPPPLPAYAHRIPFLDDWACDSGYRRAGDGCERMQIPAHAGPGLIGGTWVCDHGYRRVAGRCERVAVPLNARPVPAPDVLGQGFECDRGYRRVGRQCDRAPIPRNATRDRFGEGWSCKPGYRQAGTLCIRKSIPEREAICCGFPERP